MHKVVASAEEAIQDVFDGATIMVGGFGLCGMPENLIRALAHKGVKNLNTISNNVGIDGVGMGLLLANGETYVFETGLVADLAIVKAWKGDTEGNLVYRKTARNFNPMMATAANITIAEVEHLVEPGELDPDMVHTPSVFVKRILQGELFEKRIEKRMVRKAAVDR